MVGRTVQLNKHPYTILGVAPPEFRGTELLLQPRFLGADGRPGAGGRAERSGAARHPRHLAGGTSEAGVTPAQADCRFELYRCYSGEDLSERRRQATFSLARPGLLGDMLGRPVRAFRCRADVAGGVDSAGGLREPGQPVCRARRGPVQRDCSAAGAGIEPQTHSAATVDGGGAGLARWEELPGLLGSVVLLRWLSVWQPVSDFPDQCACESGCECVWSRAAAGPGEWISFRHRSGAAGAAGQSLSDRQIGIDRHGRAAVYGARPAAGCADRGLRGAGDFFAGCGAGTGALAAQQFRLSAAERDAGRHRSGHGRIQRRPGTGHAAAHARCP